MEHYGFAEYLHPSESEWTAGYVARTNGNTAPWLDKAKEELGFDFLSRLTTKPARRSANCGAPFFIVEKSVVMVYNKLIIFAGVTGDSDEPGLAGGEMDCLRCGSPMRYRGDDQLQLGKTGFFTGSLSNLLSGALDVAIFECPNCGKIEFFNPEIAVLPDGTNST